jgi:peptide/nickel transport system substrate-binding protein
MRHEPEAAASGEIERRKSLSNGGSRMTATKRMTLTLAASLLAGATFPSGAFAQEKTVRIVLGEELDVVDPCFAARSNIGRVILQNVNETLSEFDPQTSELKPRLATGWEQVDEDTWRFELREGVKFHDGTTLDPADIAFTLDRLKVAAFACETGVKYFGDIELAVTPVDDTTVEITTTPGSPILPLLMSTVAVQPSETPADELTTKPVGTGPYLFDTWDVGRQIVLKRNPDYWGEAPEVEEAVYLFRADAAVAAAMVDAGEADIVPNLAVQDATNPETDFSYPNSETTTLRIDTTMPPTDDRRIREAMNLAIDREALRGTIFPADVEPATQMVVPTTIGFNHEIEVWPYDPERAMALIAEAKADGVPVENEIKIIGRTNIHPNATEAMEAMMAMLQSVGLNVTLQMYDVGEWDKFFVKPYPEDRPATLTEQMHDNAKGDPVFTAFVKHHSEGAHSMISDPDVDKLIEQATAATGEERARLWEEMFRRVNVEIISDIPMFHMVGFTRVSPRLDFKPTIATNSELQLSQIGFKE